MYVITKYTPRISKEVKIKLMNLLNFLSKFPFSKFSHLIPSGSGASLTSNSYCLNFLLFLQHFELTKNLLIGLYEKSPKTKSLYFILLKVTYAFTTPPLK